MLTADTSTWIAFLQAQPGEDVERLTAALRDARIRMVPAVLTELFSARHLRPEHMAALDAIPLLALHTGYWRRAGALRAQVLRAGRKARLGDALIAQTCLDHAVPLITRDHDFLVFAEAAQVQALVSGPTS